MRLPKKKQEPHEHDFAELDFIREVGTTEDRVINRIILCRKCKCGESQAFEMGDKDKMRALYAKLKKLEGDKKDA